MSSAYELDQLSPKARRAALAALKREALVRLGREEILRRQGVGGDPPAPGRLPPTPYRCACGQVFKTFGQTIEKHMDANGCHRADAIL